MAFLNRSRGRPPMSDLTYMNHVMTNDSRNKMDASAPFTSMATLENDFVNRLVKEDETEVMIQRSQDRLLMGHRETARLCRSVERAAVNQAILSLTGHMPIPNAPHLLSAKKTSEAKTDDGIMPTTPVGTSTPKASVCESLPKNGIDSIIAKIKKRMMDAEKEAAKKKAESGEAEEKNVKTDDYSRNGNAPNEELNGGEEKEVNENAEDLLNDTKPQESDVKSEKSCNENVCHNDRNLFNLIDKMTNNEITCDINKGSSNGQDEEHSLSNAEEEDYKEDDGHDQYNDNQNDFNQSFEDEQKSSADDLSQDAGDLVMAEDAAGGDEDDNIYMDDYKNNEADMSQEEEEEEEKDDDCVDYFVNDTYIDNEYGGNVESYKEPEVENMEGNDNNELVNDDNKYFENEYVNDGNHLNNENVDNEMNEMNNEEEEEEKGNDDEVDEANNEADIDYTYMCNDLGKNYYGNNEVLISSMDGVVEELCFTNDDCPDVAISDIAIDS